MAEASSSTFSADYLVVAGGGGGEWDRGAGGGAGGYRTSFPGGTKLKVAGSYPIVIGGGAAPGCGSPGNTGTPSSFQQLQVPEVEEVEH